jgi:hypothetical protein
MLWSATRGIVDVRVTNTLATVVVSARRRPLYMYALPALARAFRPGSSITQSPSPAAILRSSVSPTITVFRRTMAEQAKSKILNWVDPKDKSGEFKRQTSVFRNWISKEPGAEFPPEKDRYHLYVSYACPWGMLISISASRGIAG